ncbi:cytoglobin-1-like isoform X1 [Syngnathus acus]|uniref:cytoglobin-1-like isoform X1 n=2 Tax=Syngnathus acus TaxID=161584 RepID=UPI0018864CBC|nr:cytoglobin-1-like isoform X1 [Syngnathus acus]
MKSEHILSCDNKTKPVLHSHRDSVLGAQQFSLGQRRKGKQPLFPLRAKTKKKKKMERMQEEGDLDHLERPSSLTDKDKVNIQDSWAKVYQNCDDVGVAILIRLFVNFPSSKQYFVKFKNIEDPEGLEKNPQLRNHARRVMSSINTLVENLANPEKITSALKLLGKAHALRHKVDPAYFKILNGVILEVLGEVFPEVMTADVAGAWTKLLATVYTGVTSTYEELGWTKLSTSTG